MSEQKQWTVTFLLDQKTPRRIVFLKRAENKSFAPGYYTGIGGKVGDEEEFSDETVLDGAYRELEEETMGDLTKDNVDLNEFARCKYESGLTIYYFWTDYDKDDLPRFDPKDGKLEWVEVDDVLSKKIIPTTMAVCEEWAKRDYKVDQPFTVLVKETGKKGSVRLLEVIDVDEGLKD